MSTQASDQIETFDNRNPDRDYLIRFECPEFSCLCPKTGQPDFATIKICYVPNKLCVELKSLKLYMWHFREQGIFHEDVVNIISDHLNDKLNPRYIQIIGDFMVRGGIHTVVETSFGKAPNFNCLNP
jgi:7-cyano-7-deazaguanine reductase